MIVRKIKSSTILDTNSYIESDKVRLEEAVYCLMYENKNIVWWVLANLISWLILNKVMGVDTLNQIFDTKGFVYMESSDD